MRTCKFDDSLLKQELIVADDFPFKKEIMEIFSSYGYCNQSIAKRISILKQTDEELDNHYAELLDTMEVVVHLKTKNAVVKFDNYTLTNAATRNAILSALQERVLGPSGILQPFSTTYDACIIQGEMRLFTLCKYIFDSETITRKQLISRTPILMLTEAINITLYAKKYAQLLHEYSRHAGAPVFFDKKTPERYFIESFFNIINKDRFGEKPLNISNYTVAQYIHFCLTNTIIAPNGYVATPIAALVYDIMVLFGCLDKLDNATNKQKLDRVKRFFRVDQSGQYIRVA